MIAKDDPILKTTGGVEIWFKSARATQWTRWGLVPFDRADSEKRKLLARASVDQVKSKLHRGTSE